MSAPDLKERLGHSEFECKRCGRRFGWSKDEPVYADMGFKFGDDRIPDLYCAECGKAVIAAQVAAKAPASPVTRPESPKSPQAPNGNGGTLMRWQLSAKVGFAGSFSSVSATASTDQQPGEPTDRFAERAREALEAAIRESANALVRTREEVTKAVR